MRGERLKILRKQLHLSQHELAEKMGLKYYQVRDIELGKVDLDLPMSKLLHFLTGVNEDWLLNGTGEMLLQKMKEEERPNGEFVYVPMVKGKIRGGPGIIPDNRVDIRLAFRHEWIKRKGDPREMALIRVTGDSMEPTLYSGDIVLVNLSKNYVDPQGGIYALYFKGDEEISIKRLSKVHPSGKILVSSDNKEYPPFEIDPEDIYINGKIIWYGREIER